MLGRLKISCNNREKGCQTVVMLEDLIDHLKSCKIDKKMCEKCKLEILNDDHNCVECLLETIQKLENKLIETTINTSIRIESLETENDNYLQTIQNLSSTSDENANFTFKV